MTEISMALLELLRKHGLDNDVDFLREGNRLLSQASMKELLEPEPLADAKALPMPVLPIH